MGKRYYIILGILVIIFILINLGIPNNINWTPTYKKRDKIPYGSAAVVDFLEDIYGENNVEFSRKSPTDFLDTLSQPLNLIFVADTMNVNEIDSRAILRHVRKGNQVIFSAHWIVGDIADEMGVDCKYRNLNFFHDDSIEVGFTNKRVSSEKFSFRKEDLISYIEVDSSKNITILGSTVDNKIQFIKYSYGKGSILFHSSPKVFTNYYLLHQSNSHNYMSACLSHIPEGRIAWNEFYSTGGSIERQTELKYVLGTVQLRWAYYIIIGFMGAFFVFQSKRRQRAIPTIIPPQNSTLQFVRTTGQLYFQQGNHLNLAKKKIQFFLEKIRNKFFINTSVLDDEFVESLSNKSGIPQIEIKELLALFDKVKDSKYLSEIQLNQLNSKIESFYKKASI